MFNYHFDGISVDSEVELEQADILHAVKNAKCISANHVVADIEEGYLCFRYYRKAPAFERIRRITGYLTGSVERWNDAKRAEEHDRVKHGMEV